MKYALFERTGGGEAISHTSPEVSKPGSRKEEKKVTPQKRVPHK